MIAPAGRKVGENSEEPSKNNVIFTYVTQSFDFVIWWTEKKGSGGGNGGWVDVLQDEATHDAVVGAENRPKVWLEIVFVLVTVWRICVSVEGALARAKMRQFSCTANAGLLLISVERSCHERSTLKKSPLQTSLQLSVTPGLFCNGFRCFLKLLLGENCAEAAWTNPFDFLARLSQVAIPSFSYSNNLCDPNNCVKRLLGPSCAVTSRYEQLLRSGFHWTWRSKAPPLYASQSSLTKSI